MKRTFIILIFSLFTILSAHAEDLVMCLNSKVCKCPNAKDTKFTTEFKFMGRRAIACRPLVAQIIEILEQPQRKVFKCEDPNPDTLYDQVISSFPQGCGVKWPGFNKDGFRETVAKFIEDGTVLCDEEIHHTMCTSAVFLAFIKAMKNLRAKELITQEQFDEWTTVDGTAWRYINNQARPDLLVQELLLGEGKTLRRDELPAEGWPREGDLVQVWREDNSGHATVFAGYLKDINGVTQAICFWSANNVSKGYGRSCESLDVVNRLIVGRLNQ